MRIQYQTEPGNKKLKKGKNERKEKAILLELKHEKEELPSGNGLII